jgi:hypothetical protein
MIKKRFGRNKKSSKKLDEVFNRLLKTLNLEQLSIFEEYCLLKQEVRIKELTDEIKAFKLKQKRGKVKRK